MYSLELVVTAINRLDVLVVCVNSEVDADDTIGQGTEHQNSANKPIIKLEVGKVVAGEVEIHQLSVVFVAVAAGGWWECLENARIIGKQVEKAKGEQEDTGDSLEF